MENACCDAIAICDVSNLPHSRLSQVERATEQLKPSWTSFPLSILSFPVQIMRGHSMLFVFVSALP